LWIKLKIETKKTEFWIITSKEIKMKSIYMITSSLPSNLTGVPDRRQVSWWEPVRSLEPSIWPDHNEPFLRWTQTRDPTMQSNVLKPTICSSSYHLLFTFFRFRSFAIFFFAKEMNGDDGSTDAGEKTIMNGRAC
jgi:hypothetical protein